MILACLLKFKKTSNTILTNALYLGIKLQYQKLLSQVSESFF